MTEAAIMFGAPRADTTNFRYGACTPPSGNDYTHSHRDALQGARLGSRARSFPTRRLCQAPIALADSTPTGGRHGRCARLLRKQGAVIVGSRASRSDKGRQPLFLWARAGANGGETR